MKSSIPIKNPQTLRGLRVKFYGLRFNQKPYGANDRWLWFQLVQPYGAVVLGLRPYGVRRLIYDACR